MFWKDSGSRSSSGRDRNGVGPFGQVRGLVVGDSGCRETNRSTDKAMASSSSRLCSDEELQKARVDLDEFIADEDECLSGDEDEEGNKEEGKETLGKKKRKKVVVPIETVQTFLNYKCNIPVREHESEHSGDIGTLSRVSNVFTRHFLDRMSALQDKLRHEVEAKGYAEYEVTDDEEEEVQEEKHEDTTRQQHHSGGLMLSGMAARS